MFEETELHTLESSAQSPEVTLEASYESVPEVAQPSPELCPKSAAEIAGEYGVSDKTIQSWYKAIVAAYCWLDPGTLKTGSSNKTRYTPLCQDLIAQYRSAVKELSEEAWIAATHAANTDKVPSRPSSIPATKPDHHTAMISYQAQAGEMNCFTPPNRKTFQYTSTEEFMAKAKQNAETALEVTQSNSSSLADALISQMQQEGQKLGLTLFQAKYGTAQSVVAELEQALAKKSGLIESETPSG